MIPATFLGPLAPLVVDLVLCLGLLLVFLGDLLLPAGDKRVLGTGAFAALSMAFAATFVFDTGGDVYGAYFGGPWPVLFKRVFYVSGGFAVLAAMQFGDASWPRRTGEYFSLVLTSVLGMSLLAGARDLLLWLVCIELMGLPLVVLAAWSRKSRRGIEGALKLYLVGAVSSVTLMYGVSLLTGMAGTTSLPEVLQAMRDAPAPVYALAAALVLGGMGFKLGVFPFHQWVPDTYQGAPTPVVVFLCVAPKAAGAAALCQLLFAGMPAMMPKMQLPLLLLAAVTLITGNLLALPQGNVKRLLAYSGVGHIGLVLLAVATSDADGLGIVGFYLFAYLVTNTGAFLVVHAVRQGGGGRDELADFDGLVSRNGWLAMAMLLFLLSLAGIPFVVGFWAKLYVFLVAWVAQLQGLVFLGALLSVVALFYYLRVARAMFMKPAAKEDRIAVDFATNLGIVLCVFAVVGMGLYPSPFLESAMAAAHDFVGIDYAPGGSPR